MGTMVLVYIFGPFLVILVAVAVFAARRRRGGDRSFAGDARADEGIGVRNIGHVQQNLPPDGGPGV